jgi:hypothetical protein
MTDLFTQPALLRVVAAERKVSENCCKDCTPGVCNTAIQVSAERTTQWGTLATSTTRCWLAQYSIVLTGTSPSTLLVIDFMIM